MGRKLDVATSIMGTFLAQGRGISSLKNSNKPRKPLKLYDIETCPFCRIVREALTDLDLDVIIYPCPKGGERFRPVLKERASKLRFPYIIDPNTDTEMFESVDIIQYLYQQYGIGKVPGKTQIQFIRTPASMVISGMRIFKGMSVKPSKKPVKLLELYSFESSPFARLVRELLCELEIPYLVRNVGRTNWQDHMPPPLRARFIKGYTPSNTNRKRLLEQTGTVTVPFLIDPNTQQEIGDSVKIIDHIKQNYGKSME